MSPKGRPTNDLKNKRFEIRLSQNTYNTLEECSKELEVTKSEVIHKGIELVRKELDKKKIEVAPRPKFATSIPERNWIIVNKVDTKN